MDVKILTALIFTLRFNGRRLSFSGPIELNCKAIPPSSWCDPALDHVVVTTSNLGSSPQFIQKVQLLVDEPFQCEYW